MTSLSEAMRQVDYSDLPLLRSFAARDGAALSYRAYPHAGDKVVVLIHGSSGESTGMHALARAAAGAGFAVCVPELRGHGSDGRLGDIDYAGQLDDDLDDLMKAVRGDHPRASFTLVGHSSGGGFALRIAEGPRSGFFSRYVLLARGAPLRRSHLAPVRLAPTYSFVLQQSFCAPPDALDRLAEVRAPITLLVGEKDELFYAERFAPLLRRRAPDVSIEVLDGVDHIGIIVRPGAIAAVVAALETP